MEESKKEDYREKYQAYQKKVVQESLSKNKEKEEAVELEYKDYLAFTIALFESVFFPILVVIGVLLFVVFAFYFLGI